MSVSIILDFETLSTAPTAVITEIGCLAVCRESLRPLEALDLRPAILPQIAMGRTCDADTIRWHESKGTLPDNMGTMPLMAAMRKLVAFVEYHEPCRIWAWGKDFERPLYEDAARMCGLRLPPYQFSKFACARDRWQDAYGEAKAPERYHHALQDCHDELRDLVSALAELNLTNRF
jgi:hypothetical protein